MRAALLPAACIAAMAYFGYHALAGNSGLMSLSGYRAEQKRLSVTAASVAERRAVLERKVHLLARQGADPDLADELVRQNLGLVRPDEVVLPLSKGN